jgi:Icc-related predicted phosphoesterase
MLTPLGVRIQEEQPDCILYCGGTMKGQARAAEYENAKRFHGKPSMASAEIQKEILEDEEHLRQFMLFLADTQKTVYVLPGLFDAPEATYFKTVYALTRLYQNLRPVHEMVYHEDSFLVSGFGGQLTVGEDDREFLLRYTTPWAEFTTRHLPYMPGEKVLMTYTPPVCRLDQADGERLGMLFVNELIEKVGPRLLVCGQAHSSPGKVKLGTATVVNPGPLYKGQYAVVDYPSCEARFERLVDPSIFE